MNIKKLEKEKDELIMVLKNYLEQFIKRYKTHSSLHLLDISQHLSAIKDYHKQMRKLNRELSEKHRKIK